MYNIRYHIASLVAVFLALTVGLILGGLVVGRGALDDQQAQLIDGLRADLDELSSQNAELEDRLGLQEAFATEASKRLVTGALRGRRIAIVANGGRTDGLVAVQDAIEAAGGVAVPIILSKPRLGLDDEGTRSAISSTEIDPETMLASVAASLAAEWTSPGTRPVTDALDAAGALDATALDDGPVSSVVTIAFFEGEPDEGGIALAAAVKRSGGNGVGASPEGAEADVAAAAADAGIGATNVLGTPAGAYSLVRLLADSALQGLYGIGAGAQALVPPASLSEGIAPAS